MYDLLSSREMKLCDKNTIEYFGIPPLVLMERAALAVFCEIKARFPQKVNRILIVCGAGNNGGDGFSAARLLHLDGYDTAILFPMDEKKMTPETKAQSYSAKQYGIPEISDLSGETYDVVVDALFGIGLSRKIEGRLAELIGKLNELSAFKIAVDIPSGIETDTGRILGTAFLADLTVTFGFAKIGQLLYPGAAYAGELIVADMGIDKNSFLGQEPLGRYMKESDIGLLLPKRTPYSNKGSYGRALVVAGSPDMAGAAYFAAKAAYYSGCGLVRILTAKENREILLTKLPEAIITTYGANGPLDGTLNECLDWADAVLAGPGLSQSGTAEALVKKILIYCTDCTKKIVLDADALNLISKDMTLFKELSGEYVLTPHLGEMSRLTGKEIPKIQEDILHTAVDFAKQYQACCVLKDARTVIGMPDGSFFVNTTGNDGMAVGGSGDVLAGFLTGFLAQKIPLKNAAVLSVFLHGAAGDLAKEKRGAYGMVASDILELLPKAIKRAKKE